MESARFIFTVRLQRDSLFPKGWVGPTFNDKLLGVLLLSIDVFWYFPLGNKLVLYRSVIGIVGKNFDFSWQQDVASEAERTQLREENRKKYCKWGGHVMVMKKLGNDGKIPYVCILWCRSIHFRLHRLSAFSRLSCSFLKLVMAAHREPT